MWPFSQARQAQMADSFQTMLAVWLCWQLTEFLWLREPTFIEPLGKNSLYLIEISVYCIYII